MSARIKNWWHDFTYSGKRTGIAIASLAFVWSFVWFFIGWLIPEPRGESSVYYIVFWLCALGVLVGGAGVAWQVAEATNKL
jgi:hypothetical protein